MADALIRARSRVCWTADAQASALLLIRAADAADHRVVDEDLSVSGAVLEEGPRRPDGARPPRLHAAGGPVGPDYRAPVVVDGAARAAADDDVPLPRAAEIDMALLEWTLASRCCPSDVLGPTAHAQLGERPRTRALLPQVAGWVRERVDDITGASDALTAAADILLRRRGVSRDMAHLAVTSLRALDVRARLVAGYAADLEPPDCHALVEAHDGGARRLLDATGLAPAETVARIAGGRDAAEVAWATTSGAFTLDGIEVEALREGDAG